MGRQLKFNIFRYNPLDNGAKPGMQTYKLEETESLTIFIALNKIREEQDPSLQFDFACRAAVCGSCAMMINGRPKLACHTLTKDLPARITLLPLPVFKLIGDPATTVTFLPKCSTSWASSVASASPAAA